MMAPGGAAAKRAMDLVGAGVGLALTAPVLVGASAAILLTDGRPILFRQHRVGRGGKQFEILKFRSMRNGSAGLQVSSDRDPRITKVGALLRRAKVDELPQLLNVLRGEMSLVGPRPEVPRYVALWPAKARPLILSVRPGITDPASIAFRNESEILAASDDPEATYIDDILPRKAAMYVEYVRRQSLIGDIGLIMSTVKKVARP